MNKSVRPTPTFYRSEGADAAWLGFLSPYKVKIDSFQIYERADDPSFRVLNHFSEPPTLIAPPEQIIREAAEYDLILTYSKEVCARVPHAVFFPFGSRWVPKGSIIRNEDASFIFSEGGVNHWQLEGYEQRQRMLRSLLEEDSPRVHVYYSTRRTIRPESREILVKLFERGHTLTPLTDQKLPAFESRYQIVIENEFSDSWFTEKIVDCFARRVVPIYIGCNNIGEFFDSRGIIFCTDSDDMVKKIKATQAGEKLHDDAAVDVNYELCDYYEDVRGRFRSVVEAEILRRALSSGSTNDI